MNEKLSRADIITYLVAICIKNNVTPNDSRFAGLIRKACAAKFGYDKYKATSFIDALISAWRFNKWKDYVEDSPYLTKEEKERWLKQHGT
jgi:hypothetical protein